jgi:hypothetical protein
MVKYIADMSVLNVQGEKNTGGKERNSTLISEVREMWLQPRNTSIHQELRQARDGVQLPKGAQPCQHLHCGPVIEISDF